MLKDSRIFIASMWQNFYEWTDEAPSQETTIDYVLSGHQRALNCIEDLISELTTTESKCKIYEIHMRNLNKDNIRVEKELARAKKLLSKS